MSQNQLREAREQAEEVTRERDDWKARAERLEVECDALRDSTKFGRALVESSARATAAERERDVAISMSLKRSNDLAAAQARVLELRAALASIRVTSSHVVDSPGEALWLGLGEEDLACDHFEDEARKLEFFAQATLSAPQDTTALREFGRKCIERERTRRDWQEAEAIVDAVLKGSQA